MTKRDDLLALAAQAEAAVGADRDLFERAFVVCHGNAAPSWHPAVASAWIDRWKAFAAFIEAAAWLDAAMALVPEGVEGLPLSFKVERFYLGNGITKCRASVWDGLGTVSSLDTASDATTPALALTAAALRGRASMEVE